MPATTAPQYKAMAAAMGGNSTLGIPQRVGKEFVQATPPAQRSKFMKQPKKTGKQFAFPA